MFKLPVKLSNPFVVRKPVGWLFSHFFDAVRIRGFFSLQAHLTLRLWYYMFIIQTIVIVGSLAYSDILGCIFD